MPIEQIIEFELREQGPLGGTCTPKLVILRITQTFLKGDLRVDYYLLLNISGGNVSYFLLSGPNHLQNLTPKCKIFNLLWS